MPAKISRILGVLRSGSINALILLCYAIGYGLMIFSDSLERYVSVGIPSLLVGVCLVGLVVTLWGSQQFRIAGPDSNTAPILAVSLASIGLDTRARGGSESAVIGTVLMALSATLLKLLTYLKPGEKRTIEVDAPIGSFYRISDLLNNTVCVANLGPRSSENIQRVQVALIDHKLRIVDKEVLPAKLETPTFRYNYEQGWTLPGGKIVFELENRTSERSSVWIILLPQDVNPPRLEFETFLSGKRLLTDSVFRDLFGDEALGEIVDSAAVRQSIHEREDAYPDTQGYADLRQQAVLLFLAWQG